MKTLNYAQIEHFFGNPDILSTEVDVELFHNHDSLEIIEFNLDVNLHIQNVVLSFFNRAQLSGGDIIPYSAKRYEASSKKFISLRLESRHLGVPITALKILVEECVPHEIQVEKDPKLLQHVLGAMEKYALYKLEKHIERKQCLHQ